MPKSQEEQRGYAKVHQICAEMNAIWRLTPNTDVGIDGQIEFLEEHDRVISTGKIIAVQVKSGDSYFIHEDANYFKYHAKPRHRRYWSRVNIPMILVLHHHNRNLTLYARVKHQLLTGSTIYVPKDSRLAKSSRKQLLHMHDEDMALINRSFNPEAVVTNFKELKLQSTSGKEVNGLHFLLSCTTRNGAYFELRYPRLEAGLRNVSEARNLRGEVFNEFVLRSVMKCWGYELVEPFEREFEEYWYDRRVMPDIVVPLTVKGRAVVRHLWQGISEYMVHRGLRFSDVDIARKLAETIVSDAKEASRSMDRESYDDEYFLRKDWYR